MASLFKANDRKTGSAVALKVPYLQIESDPAGFDRFKREEEIGLQLNHPYILKIIPVENKSRPYIAMEYLEGQTLSELLKSIRPLPEPDAVKIASRVCEALEYMHSKGVIHRDLKPQNIMLCNDGSMRIMDFGIARSQASRRLTFVGFTPAMGTPDYMAPEQVRGSRGDQRTDIYALGAILYEMSTGETPFGGDSAYVIMNARVTGDPVAPRKANPQLTPVLEEIILHAMERDPKRRYQSAAEMKAELDDYEKVEMTQRHSRLQAPQLWKSRFRMLPMILGFVFLQVILFFLLLLYFKKR
jgi:serine/threonine-protein kinase